MKLFLSREAQSSPDYQPLGWEKSQNSGRWSLATIIKYAALVVLSIGLLAGSAVGGYYIGLKKPSPELLAPIGTVDHKFHYNKPFAQRPSEESDHWWSIVFPKGRGFIYNPDLAPQPMGLSVFHQLHCLDAIRRSYYAALDGIDLTNTEDEHLKPGHVRHCVDYLRQSIMCHADTNLEPIDPDLGGVTGWDSPRKCRDIVGLIKWANKWRTHNQTTIV